MPSSYTPHPVRRAVLIIGAMATLLLVAFLLWGRTRPLDTNGKKTAAAASPAAFTSEPNPSTRSRMVEADPEEISALLTGNNAASDWRKAFALAKNLTDRERAILKVNRPATPPATEAEIAALLKKIAPIIALLREGASKPNCDWGIRSPSFHTSFTYLSEAQFLSEIGLFDATQRMQTQPAEAARNLKAMERLGYSLDQAMVGGMVNATVQMRVITFLTKHGSSFPLEIRRDLRSSLLSQTEFADTLQKSLSNEAMLLKDALAAFQASRKNSNEPLTEREQELQFGRTADEIGQNVARLTKMAPILAETLYTSDADFQKKTGDLLAANPAPEIEGRDLVSDSILYWRRNVRSVIVKQAMARTGLAMLDEGIPTLSRHLDPLTGKAFGHRVVDANGSFELQSEVLHQEKPVTLTFKRTAKR